MNVVPHENGKVKIEPLTDQKIIAEIQAMASGRSVGTGRTAIIPPVTLPHGYNYNSMQTVSISGTSWVTYVAWSTRLMMQKIKI